MKNYRGSFFSKRPNGVDLYMMVCDVYNEFINEDCYILRHTHLRRLFRLRSEKCQEYPMWGTGLGLTQRKSTREGFWRLLGIFGGYFWKSFPCKNPKENHGKTKKNLDKAKKN